MQNHAIDSSNPPSPFISLTTNPDVAKIFAGPGGTVYTISTNRAVLNTFNEFLINGLPEEEWLVPLIIHSEEIIKRTLIK